MSARPRPGAFDFAELARQTVDPCLPAGRTTSALSRACAEYFAASAMAEAPEASDAVTDIGCAEMHATALRIAGITCRSFADIAAKLTFVEMALSEQGELGRGERAVLASVREDARALAGGAP